MEGKGLKSVIMCVLILGLVVEQIQVESLCCPTLEAYACYNRCRLIPPACAEECGCTLEDVPCPRGFQKFNLIPNSEDAILSGYCKLGCTSSLCDTINTDVGSKEVKNAVEHCKNACSRFCTEGIEIATVAA